MTFKMTDNKVIQYEQIFLAFAAVDPSIMSLDRLQTILAFYC
jgi:hypothetical protein